jgi:hypothetical protein
MAACWLLWNGGPIVACPCCAALAPWLLSLQYQDRLDYKGSAAVETVEADESAGEGQEGEADEQEDSADADNSNAAAVEQWLAADELQRLEDSRQQAAFGAAVSSGSGHSSSSGHDALDSSSHHSSDSGGLQLSSSSNSSSNSSSSSSSINATQSSGSTEVAAVSSGL